MWLCYSSNTHMPNKIRLTPHICTGIDGEVCPVRVTSKKNGQAGTPRDRGSGEIRLAQIQARSVIGGKGRE
jgi:hypothetical protein